MLSAPGKSRESCRGTGGDSSLPIREVQKLFLDEMLWRLTPDRQRAEAGRRGYGQSSVRPLL